MEKTTALVDTNLGEISLSRAKIPNSIAIKEFEEEYAVINGDEVDFYAFDPATNAVAKNDLLSVTGISDPVGIAAAQNDNSVWVLTKNELKRYDFTGGEMSNNPYLSVSGLTDVFSIGSSSLDDTVVVLSKDSGGKGVVTTYKPTAEGALQTVPQLTFSTGLEDAFSVSMVPDTSDIAVSAGDAIYYYSYDIQTQSYAQNMIMSVATGNQVNGVCVQKTGNSYVSLSPLSADYYAYDIDTSAMKRVPTLSTTSQHYSYAVTLKQGKYEYAVLTEDGEVQYWMFDDTTGSMVRNSALELTGVAIKKRYDSPAEYVSTTVNTQKNYDELKVVPEVNCPSGAKFTWSFSLDGGVTWKEMQSEQWTAIDISNSFTLKAKIEAPDFINQPPPKLLGVKLEGTVCEFVNIECIAITKNHPDQQLPTSHFPVRAKKGSQVVFAADTSGFTQDVTVVFSTGEEKDLIPDNPVTEEKNRWIGSITFEPDAVEGAITGVTFKGYKNSKQIETDITDFIVINQNVIYNLDLQLKR